MSTLRRNPAEEPLEVGDRLLDRYVIEERLTNGGHSIVYRGEDERLKRSVCVKVFHRINSGDGAYRTAYEHFVQEAFALSKLTHPNTLRIYDFGYLEHKDATDQRVARAPGAPFQVSEFMNDGTLWSQVKAHGPVSREQAIHIITALGGALSEAHHCDIIHRDIKPHNILFNASGRNLMVKLADFGIAKAISDATGVLHNQADDTRVVVGRPFLMYSPWWAAPEQLAGLPLEPCSDIYSLALSIIYMLTGTVVFRSNDPVESYEQRQSSDSFIDSVFMDSDMPESVVAILKRACHADPGQRPGDAEELAGTLTAELRGGGTTARPRPRLRSVPNVGMPEGQQARPSSPPRRLHVSSDMQLVGDRRVHFVPAPGGEVTLTCCNGTVRLRLVFVPAAAGFSVHIRGMSCFVARDQGRPSSAVQFEQSGRCDLVAPNRQVIATMQVSTGKSAAGHRVFALDAESIAIGFEECSQVVALDFGPGGDCLLVYTPSPWMRQANAR